MTEIPLPPMSWNKRITIARKAKGLTKSEFARRVRVTHATVHDWENGDIKTIKGENLVNVCRVLEISESYLMSGVESAPASEPELIRSLGLEAETAAELRLLSVYRVADKRERGVIDDAVELVRGLIEARTRGDQTKGRR